jgi:DNA polymerase III sliding clamp (beta) subunit (PCNA family)
MKLHKDIKIEKATSTDATRYAINEPYLEIVEGKGTLVATNGMIMSMVPVEIEEGDVEGYVNQEAIKASRKTFKPRDVKTFKASGCIQLFDGQTFPRNGKARDYQFPKFRQVIPKFDKPTIKIGIDATLLARLAEAMGTEGVVLEIQDEFSPILVTPSNSSGTECVECEAVGVIMPIRLS